MDDLDRMLESYTQRYREASQASPEAVEGALGRVVERSVQGGPAMDLGPDLAAPAATGTAKIVVSLAVGATLVGATWLGTRDSSPPPQVDTPPAVAAPVPVEPAPEPVVETEVIDAPQPASAPAPPQPEPKRSRKAPMPATDDAMLAELELLRQARAAQRGGQLERALGILAEHKRRFPSGALGEERMATRVIVLCGLGRHGQAKSAESDLRRRYPRSTYLETVLQSCAP